MSQTIAALEPAETLSPSRRLGRTQGSLELVLQELAYYLERPEQYWRLEILLSTALKSAECIGEYDSVKRVIARLDALHQNVKMSE